MAEGTATLVDNFFEQLMLKVFNLATDTLNLVLLVGYTIDETHDTYSDVLAYEASGAGYTAGGTEITGQVVTEDNTNHRAKLVWDDVLFTGLNVGTPSHAAVIDITAGNLIVGFIELGRASNGGDYTVETNALGALLLGNAS